MRLQALLPLLIHSGEPRTALVVGFGTGITAGALLADSGLKTRVVAELLPSVVRAATFFSGNQGAATDPRIEIRIGDGRQELLRHSQRYDLITLEPPPPSAAGVVNLYSTDFYELCRTRLQPGGLMAQWWPLPTQNDEDSRSLVRSFLDVFPNATAWSTDIYEVLLVGSSSPIELDGERIAGRYSQPGVRSVLAEVGIESPEALLATWVTDRTGLERFARDALPVTDDRPLIEHASWVRRGEIRRVLPRLLALATDVPLPVGDRLRPAVEAERRELLGFYRFSLHAFAGEPDEAGAALREVLATTRATRTTSGWPMEGSEGRTSRRAPGSRRCEPCREDRQCWLGLNARELRPLSILASERRLGRFSGPGDITPGLGRSRVTPYVRRTGA